MTKTYLSGPITGLPRAEAVERFAQAEETLTAVGVSVLNPFDVEAVGEKDWAGFMRGDLAAMLTTCDSIVMLAGWSMSVGARLEQYVVTSCGLRFYEWETALSLASHGVAL